MQLKPLFLVAFIFFSLNLIAQTSSADYQKEQTSKAGKDAANAELIRQQISGDWFGMIEYARKTYFAEVTFEGANGNVRIVTVTDGDNKYRVSQKFRVDVMPLESGQTFYTELIPTAELIHEYDSLPAAVAQHSILKFNQAFWTFIADDKIYVLNFQKKNKSTENLSADELQDLAEKLYAYQEDLTTKVKKNGKGFGTLRMLITAGEGGRNGVKLRNDKIISDFGEIYSDKKGVVFVSRAWSSDAVYLSAGRIPDIRYLNKNGKVETGSLDILYEPGQRRVFYFNETP